MLKDSKPLAKIEIVCPHCDSPNSIESGAFRRTIREFGSTNQACSRCGLWFRIDIFIGASHLSGFVPPISTNNKDDLDGS